MEANPQKPQKFYLTNFLATQYT